MNININRYIEYIEIALTIVFGGSILACIFGVLSKYVRDKFLLLLCRLNMVTLAEFFLYIGADPNSAGKNGDTVLMYAASKGRLKLVNMLINHGADVNIQNYTGVTALMKASRGEHELTVNYLKQHGANVEAQTLKNQTALTIAQKAGKSKIVSILSSSKSRVKKTGKSTSRRLKNDS